MSFLAHLRRAPYELDFHQALRRLQHLFPNSPQWGSAARPSDEPVRFGQQPSLRFEPSMLTHFEPAQDDRPARLSVAFFGLFGPNGPLPLHLTEYARDRVRHVGDRTFASFVDLFHHRMLVLFQRAWAAAQPTVSHDRPETDRFRAYVASVFGSNFGAHVSAGSTWQKLQYAGHFANPSRHAEGLQSMISSYFGVPASIEQFVGQWLEIPDRSRLRLGVSAEVSTLGRTAVLGRRVWRHDTKFRIVLGPLTRAQFDGMLPGGRALGELRELVRAYVNDELDWDVRLVLDGAESDQAALGGGSRLSWNARLGRRAGNNTEHVIVHPESGRTERSVAA